MNVLLSWLQISSDQLIMVALVALLVGLSKAGVSGVIMLAIPLLAGAFGSRESTGLMTLLFIIGDWFAMQAYRGKAQWGIILRLLPAAVSGLLIAVFVGRTINDRQFGFLLAVVVLICLILMLVQEFRGSESGLPRSWWIYVPIGLLAGFSTMIGNAAGPILAVYLLALRLTKEHYLGTAAYFFAVINLIKLPMQVFVWRNIDWTTAAIALAALPVVFIGIRLGVHLLRYLRENAFRYLVLAMTLLATVRLFFL